MIMVDARCKHDTVDERCKYEDCYNNVFRLEVKFSVKAKLRLQNEHFAIRGHSKAVVCMAVNVLGINGVQSSGLTAKDLISSLVVLSKFLQNAPLDL